jgi:hypothetical protein
VSIREPAIITARGNPALFEESFNSCELSLRTLPVYMDQCIDDTATRFFTTEDHRTSASGLNPKLLAIDRYERALSLALDRQLVVLVV